MFKQFLAVSKNLADWQIDKKNRFVCQFCTDEIHRALQSIEDWPDCCNRRMELKPFEAGQQPTTNSAGYIPAD